MVIQGFILRNKTLSVVLGGDGVVLRSFVVAMAGGYLW